MDKNILNDYIDACELIKETEEDIRKLKKKKQVVQDSVKGSMNEFPYTPQSFHIQGSLEEPGDRQAMKLEEALLKERKENAEKLKLDVESWLNTIPNRMQRIIRYKIFEGMSWEQTARKLGRKATEASVKMELKRFMEKM